MLVQALLWLILVNLTQTRDSSKERTSGDELLSSDWLVGKPMGLLLQLRIEVGVPSPLWAVPCQCVWS